MDTFEYIQTLAKFRKELPEPPSWIRITTITMCASNITGKIDPAQIQAIFNAAGGSIIVRPKGSQNGFEWKIKPPKRGSNFYNCVSICYTDYYSTKAVKLFSNGSIHIAGGSNVLDCKRIVNQLKVLLPLILKKDTTINFEMFKIVMINTNFTVNKMLNLYTVKRSMEAAGFDVVYEPSNYSGAVVKFKPQEGMKQVTVNIFSSGSIIITGAETLMEVAHAYRTINMNLGPECTIKPSEEIYDYGITMGASFTEWLRVLNVGV